MARAINAPMTTCRSHRWSSDQRSDKPSSMRSYQRSINVAPIMTQQRGSYGHIDPQLGNQIDLHTA